MGRSRRPQGGGTGTDSPRAAARAAHHHEPAGQRLARWSSASSPFFVALGTIGLNLTPLLAGATVVGATLGFGAQSMVRDLLAGLLLISRGPIRHRRHLSVGDTTGTVEDLTSPRHPSARPTTAPSGSCPTVRSATWPTSRVVGPRPWSTFPCRWRPTSTSSSRRHRRRRGRGRRPPLRPIVSGRAAGVGRRGQRRRHTHHPRIHTNTHRRARPHRPGAARGGGAASARPRHLRPAGSAAVGDVGP